MTCTCRSTQRAVSLLLSIGAAGLLSARIPAAGQFESPRASPIPLTGAAGARRSGAESADARHDAHGDYRQEIAVLLSARSANGKRILVDGIVCDNLRDTPADQKDFLTIDLPARFSGYEMSGFVTNPDGSKADQQGHNNVGVLAVKRGSLIYFPPDEFNTDQEPQTPENIDSSATRIVLVHLRVRALEGGWRELPPKSIVLARPPVVLIHGINTGPDCWAVFAQKIGLLGAGGKPIEFPFTTLDHNTPANYAGVDFGDRNRYPYGLFAGCGPVEIGAALLSRHIDNVLQNVCEAAPLLFYQEATGRKGPAPFVYHRPQDSSGRALRLAIRRVDIVAYSYGGVIARWYLASESGSNKAPACRYRDRYALTDSRGKALNFTPPTSYRGNVRKLITLGSMWRGVPLSNYINEIRFSKSDDPNSLAKAPIQFPRWMPRSDTRRITTNRTAGGLVESIDAVMKLRTPATEVMAVESPWMRALIYGTPSPNSSDNEQSREAIPGRPFRDEVAYGSVAGDNSGYLDFGSLHGLCLPGVVALFQQPPRFPFVALEHRGGAGGIAAPMIGGADDYTDGIVPLWSGLIPGSAPGASQLVHVSHGGYFTDKDTVAYVARWLNNATLPMGKVLRLQWNSSIVSSGERKRWIYEQGRMAPVSERELYACVSGVGRLAPEALHASRSIALHTSPEEVVTVEWNAPAGGHLDRVILYKGALDDEGDRAEQPKRISVVKASSEKGHWVAILPMLQKDRAFYIIAEAIVDNSPDPPIRLKSERIRLKSERIRVPISKPVAPIRF